VNNFKDFLSRYFKYIFFRKQELLRPVGDIVDVNANEVETETATETQESRPISANEKIILWVTWFLLIVGGLSFLTIFINSVFFPNKPISCFVITTFSSILSLFIGSVGTAFDLDSKS
jgi:RsiW-degrading membrane proteinase PrsW (M82 family)